MDTVTVVTTQSLVHLKHAHDLVSRVKRLRGSDADIRILINQHERRWFGRRIQDQRVADVFSDLPVSYVPLDPDTLHDSISQGASAYAVNSSSAFAKAMLEHDQSFSKTIISSAAS